ncbi:MAG: hypothetical protein HYV35_03060 [Lentisphaerae bacterium]|nr:hypothetical protein [Lentisphaerota bacterium]
MSMTKLTLNAEPALINAAKKLAAERNTSVSALFSRLVATMGRTERAKSPTMGPITRKATGLLRLPAGRTPREILAVALSEKYGLRR